MCKLTFLNDLAELLEVDVGELDPEFDLTRCLTWDSLSMVSTIALLDEHLGVKINGQILEGVKTISELLTMGSYSYAS